MVLSRYVEFSMEKISPIAYLVTLVIQHCSSFCLKKRKIPPTGIAIYNGNSVSTSVKYVWQMLCLLFTFFVIATAREQGYESVAHLLMDRLKRQAF